MIPSSLLQALDLGALRFPAKEAEGVATLKVKGKYKIDEKKPHGKDDPTLTGVGKEAREVTVEMWWSTRIDEETRTFLKEISPVGLNAGKAWEISHPDCELYSLDAIMFTTMGELSREVGKCSISFTALSWKKTPPVQKGTGAKTATTAEQWRNVPMTGGGVTTTTYLKPTGNGGFEETTAPKAAVPK